MRLKDIITLEVLRKEYEELDTQINILISDGPVRYQELKLRQEVLREQGVTPAIINGMRKRHEYLKAQLMLLGVDDFKRM